MRLLFCFLVAPLAGCLAPRGDDDESVDLGLWRDLPISASGELVSELTSDDETTTRSVVAVRVEADVERIAPAAGGRVVLGLRSNRGDVQALETVQGSSTNDNPDADQVDELFYAAEIERADLRFRIGLLDGNAEFAALESTSEFFNPAPATSPTIVGIPTWPLTAPGVEMVFEPRRSVFSVGGGVYDSSFEQSFRDEVELPEFGLFAIGEGRLTFEDVGFRGIAGAWFEEESRGAGGYAGFEQRLFGTEDSRSASAFGLLGQSDSAAADVERHGSLGIELRAPWSRREDDATGIMASHVSGDGFGDETVFEAFYRAALTDAASVTVSLQSVDRPFDDGGDHELVLGLRGTLEF